MQLKPRKVAILGATGSVGQSTLALVREVNEAASGHAHDGPISVEVLTANQDVTGLAQVARDFRPERVVIADETKLDALRSELAGSGVEVAAGTSVLEEAGGGEADWVMAAIVGAAGLAPTMAAVKRGTTVALANKECLVSAGSVFLDEVKRSGATLLPVDSEHNAIYQVFDFERPEAVEKITLTASGGPFRTWSKAEIVKATPAQAVAHPNWSMGAKISVDSATLMNKGLELIEAAYLFPVEPEQIDIVIHPQSVVHSFVTYRDGSVLAQMGSPDMKIPIAYTLAWPDRMEAGVKRLDLAGLGTISFEAPDFERFPALRLARAALQSGGATPTILNAANEVAVAEFLAGRMGFHEIVRVVEETISFMGQEEGIGGALPSSLGDIIGIDHAARKWALKRAGEVAAA